MAGRYREAAVAQSTREGRVCLEELTSLNSSALVCQVCCRVWGQDLGFKGQGAGGRMEGCTLTTRVERLHTALPSRVYSFLA